MKKERMDALSSRISAMGIPHSYTCSNSWGDIFIKVKDICDLDVFTEIDDDADDDIVVFSIRRNRELLRLDYDKVSEFPAHLGKFMHEIERRLANTETI